MEQMVYVVLVGEVVIGVYNEYADAEKNTLDYPSSTITPVIVDRTDDRRIPCDTPSEVVKAMEYELQNIGQEDEDEDEDEEYDDEEEEEEEEEEPIDPAVMTLREFLYHAVTGE